MKRERLRAIIVELKRGRLSGESRSFLLNQLQRKLDIADRRAEALRLYREKVSKLVRGAVRTEAERLLNQRPWIEPHEAVSIVQRLARNVLNAGLPEGDERPEPCRRIVEEELEKIRAEKEKLTSSFKSSPHPVYVGCTASTT